MDLAEYRKINTIIERDSADAAYKYALLRGVIEVCWQVDLRSGRHEHSDMFLLQSVPGRRNVSKSSALAFADRCSIPERTEMQWVSGCRSGDEPRPRCRNLLILC